MVCEIKQDCNSHLPSRQFQCLTREKKGWFEKKNRVKGGKFLGKRLENLAMSNYGIELRSKTIEEVARSYAILPLEC